MDASLRAKNSSRTAWRPAAVSCLLLVFVAVLLISATTTVQSEQGLTSSQTGSESGASRKDVMRPDRTTDVRPPPAPTANSNVPGGPFGR